MIKTAEEFRSLRLSDSPEEYRRASTDYATEDVWTEVIERFPELRIWVVHNKTVPLSILQVLVNDQDPAVRAAVARKRKVPSDILGQLARDPEGQVRLAVARNRSTPKAVLESLGSDPWDAISSAARRG